MSSLKRCLVSVAGAALLLTGASVTAWSQESASQPCEGAVSAARTLGEDNVPTWLVEQYCTADVVESEGDSGRDDAQQVSSEAYTGPWFYGYALSASETQLSCWRISMGQGEPVGPRRYGSRAAAVRAATEIYGPTTSGGGRLIGTDAVDGVYRQQQMLPCVDEADEVQAAVVTPLQRALVGWQAWAQPLAPAVLTEPTTHSITGVPTLVSVDDYQPDYDVDDSPRSITWSLPGDTIQLRATADHRVRWNDEDARVTEWLARNGRPFEDDDADDGFVDPELIAHTYTVKGARTIQVDVRWTGEWRDAGGAWEPLPAEPIFLVESFPLDVREIVAVGR